MLKQSIGPKARGQPVPASSDRLNAVAPKLSPQVGNVDLDRVGRVRIAFTDQERLELCAGNRSSAVSAQALEHLQFSDCEFDDETVQPQLAQLAIQFKTGWVGDKQA